jgi:hypothetical protein
MGGRFKDRQAKPDGKRLEKLETQARSDALCADNLGMSAQIVLKVSSRLAKGRASFATKRATPVLSVENVKHRVGHVL